MSLNFIGELTRLKTLIYHRLKIYNKLKSYIKHILKKPYKIACSFNISRTIFLNVELFLQLGFVLRFYYKSQHTRIGTNNDPPCGAL